jgi:hypothetical protein
LILATAVLDPDGTRKNKSTKASEKEANVGK